MRPKTARSHVAACLALACFVTTAVAAEPDAPKVLRVCADPNNPPLSNRKFEGYENKIAELLAAELGWTLEYTWFPQRMGFIRNTLRARLEDEDRFKCDLVIGVPVGFELAATTSPYLRSTWALAYAKGKGLDQIRTPEDLLELDPAKLKSLKFGAFAQTPPIDWLLKHDLLDQLVPYQRQTGDPEEYPGEMIEKDLAAGKIDVGFAWGPIAGYFVQRSAGSRLVAVPFKPDPDIKFDYSIAMGVRFGEKAWRDQVDQLIAKNRDRIRAILAAYGVPQLDEKGDLIQVAAPAASAGSGR